MGTAEGTGLRLEKTVGRKEGFMEEVKADPSMYVHSFLLCKRTMYMENATARRKGEGRREPVFVARGVPFSPLLSFSQDEQLNNCLPYFIPQVWDSNTLSQVARLTGHTGAVLALQLVKERDWLISASGSSHPRPPVYSSHSPSPLPIGDGTIRVWHTPSLSLLYLIHPPHDNTGDILSLAWIPYDQLEADEVKRPKGRHAGKEKPTGRLFAGCQDTSIQVRFPISFLPFLLVHSTHVNNVYSGSTFPLPSTSPPTPLTVPAPPFPVTSPPLPPPTSPKCLPPPLPSSKLPTSSSTRSRTRRKCERGPLEGGTA
jgi:hypothetical protein